MPAGCQTIYDLGFRPVSSRSPVVTYSVNSLTERSLMPSLSTVRPPPVICPVDDATQPDDAVHAIDGDSIPLTQGGDGYQAHGNILKDVAVVQRIGGFDAIISRLVVDGFVQVLPGHIVSQGEPFDCRARRMPTADATVTLSRSNTSNTGNRGSDTIDVKLEIPMRAFNPPGI